MEEMMDEVTNVQREAELLAKLKGAPPSDRQMPLPAGLMRDAPENHKDGLLDLAQYTIDQMSGAPIRSAYGSEFVSQVVQLDLSQMRRMGIDVSLDAMVEMTNDPFYYWQRLVPKRARLGIHLRWLSVNVRGRRMDDADTFAFVGRRALAAAQFIRWCAEFGVGRDVRAEFADPAPSTIRSTATMFARYVKLHHLITNSPRQRWEAWNEEAKTIGESVSPVIRALHGSRAVSDVCRGVSMFAEDCRERLRARG